MYVIRIGIFLLFRIPTDTECTELAMHHGSCKGSHLRRRQDLFLSMFKLQSFLQKKKKNKRALHTLL